MLERLACLLRALRGLILFFISCFGGAFHVGVEDWVAMQCHGRNSLDGDDVHGVSNLDLRFSLMPGWKELTI